MKVYIGYGIKFNKISFPTAATVKKNLNLDEVVEQNYTHGNCTCFNKL